MAFRPCVSCGKPFFGASEFTYVTWFNGEDRMAFRLVQCRSCSAELRNETMSVADVRRDDVWEMNPDVDQVVTPLTPGLVVRPAESSQESGSGAAARSRAKSAGVA